MKYGRRMQGIAAAVSLMLLMTGCASQASSISFAKEKENAVDTGFTVTSVGSYDSADTAVVMSVDQENQGITFLNMDTGKSYTLYYNGTTYFKDKYEGPMTVSQIKAGDIVDVNFLKGKRQIASVQISPKAWSYDQIDNYDLGGVNHTASIGSTVYSLPEEAAILSEGRRVEVMDVVKQDIVTIRGVDHEIYSVEVEKGHGYLKLKGEEALIGGWIEVGNSVISTISEDMLLTVPEGSYQVLLSNGRASCAKDVVIERNKETVLDVSDLKLEESRTGRILFAVTPAEATVTVDGKEIDSSSAAELSYGIHQVLLEAEGYSSLKKYIQVGSEYATIRFTLEKKEEDSGISDNSLNQNDRETAKDAAADTGAANTISENTSVSDNSTKSTTGNKIYVEKPKGVEVYLDGNYMGIAPVSFKKVTGSHTLTLRKAGYQTRSYTIYLYNDGEDITYSFADLVKETDTVSGNSSTVTSGTATEEREEETDIVGGEERELPEEPEEPEDTDTEESGDSESGETDESRAENDDEDDTGNLTQEEENDPERSAGIGGDEEETEEEVSETGAQSTLQSKKPLAVRKSGGR